MLAQSTLAMSDDMIQEIDIKTGEVKERAWSEAEKQAHDAVPKRERQSLKTIEQMVAAEVAKALAGR